MDCYLALIVAARLTGQHISISYMHSAMGGGAKPQNQSLSVH